jgi:hypothetical protein
VALVALGAVAAVVVLVSGALSDGGARSASPTSTVASTAPTTPTLAAVTSPDQLTAPTGAADTAAELTAVERGLRTADRDPARLAPLGWRQQLAYGALSNHPDWLADVLAALPDDVRSIVTANHDASTALSSPDLGPTPTSLPDWTILTPPPADVLLADYHEAETASGVPWPYLAAIHFVETRMGRIHGNSPAGAQGPMQFIPPTWAAYGQGGNVNDDRDAIFAAGRFLADHGGAADMDRALYAYNPSRSYVAAIDAYAGLMRSDARAYDGFYWWQVYYTTTSGTVRLPEGWHGT